MSDPRFQRARRSLHTPVTPSQQIRITEEEMLRDGVYDDRYPGRSHTSVRRYPVSPDVRSESGRSRHDGYSDAAPRYSTYDRQSIPPRRSATQTSIPAVRQRAPDTDDQSGGYAVAGRGQSTRSRRIHLHWSIFVGLSMFIMIIGWLAFSMLSSWWSTTLDDWHYGRPRTFQVDAVVGQGDSKANPSHFIAINLNRQIIVIEIPGGDASKTRIFNGPVLIGPGQELTPVTLTFQDVNNDGKLDMIINVQDAHFVFLNENGTFRPAPGQS
jgi:hypothetical protein